MFQQMRHNYPSMPQAAPAPEQTQNLNQAVQCRAVSARARREKFLHRRYITLIAH